MSDYGDWMAREGEAYDAPMTRPRGNAALPPEKTVDRLAYLINAELLAAESDRQGFVEQVQQARRDYRKEPYKPEELPMADLMVQRVPLTESRVDQAVGALMSALNVTPFVAAEVDGGGPGEVAHHGALSLSQELQDVQFANLLETALTETVVTGTGVLKDGVQGDRLAPDVVPIEDLILSPHSPRDIEQCTMTAQRYYEPLRWVRDQALAGVFDVDAVKKLSGTLSWAQGDGGEVEREALNLPAGDSSMTRETARVELMEVYIRVRPRPTSETEMWRCVVARQGGAGVTVLRAEPWTDGFPYTLLRVKRNSTVVYGNGFPNTLKDTQFAADMINSAALEADFLAAGPMFEVDEMSPTGKLFKAMSQKEGGAIRPRPGQIFWRRGSQEAIRAIHFNPAPPQLDARLNRLEQYANVSTIPVVPMQTYRSATEHRFAQANVSGKENMMLGSLRADLSRFLTRCARAYRKYIATPYSDQQFLIQHGGQQYGPVKDSEWNALRWVPRGMTSQADQMLRMQATQEVLILVEMFWSKLPAFQQIGEVAVQAHWKAYQMRLEALGIQEWQELIGDSPKRDPRLTDLGENAMQAGQMLMQSGPMQQNPMQQPTRESDGAVTAAPNQTGGWN